MITSQRDFLHDHLEGDVHGFVMFPSTRIKPRPEQEGDTLTLRELRAKQRRELESRWNTPDTFTATPTALPFAMPSTLSPTLFSSENQSSEPMEAEIAASGLFKRPHRDFVNFLDQTARRYAGLPQFDDHDHFTHLHGIGSWEHAMEPSVVSVFHKPISTLDLLKIGAEAGVWARQHGILAFTPHPEGTEKLMRMHLRTHDPVKRMSAAKIASIVKPITEAFSDYYDKRDDRLEYWMPGRSIIPHHNGTTDVLVWLPPWDAHPNATTNAFVDISRKFKNASSPTFWPGQGHLLGGTSPFSDEEAMYMTDKEKREAAIANYKKVLDQQEDTTAKTPLRSVPAHQFERSPAKTGVVVRGVYYAPGKLIPNIETPKRKLTLAELIQHYRNKGKT